MTEEKITTLHPQGKQGVNISKSKYEQIKKAIVEELQQKQAMTYKDLDITLNKKLKKNFDGSISWYTVTVKLDLEARGIIERIPGSSPHQIRLK